MVSWPGPRRAAGAFLDGKRMHVSAIADLQAAILSTGNLKTLAASAAHWSRLGALIGRVNRLRGYGDFLHYHLLARGALDVVVESDVNILDIAALTVIVREAGGSHDRSCRRCRGSRTPLRCWPAIQRPMRRCSPRSGRQ